jgi:3-methyladenine DNA glycosylase Tag
MIYAKGIIMNNTKINQIISNAKASLNFEGLTPSEYAVELAKMSLAGEITCEEVVERILEYYKVK